MKHRSTILLVLCLLVAVGSTDVAAKEYGKKALVGTWEFDMLRMMQSQFAAEGQEIPPSMEAMLEGSYMRITFNEDGTYRVDSKSPGGANEEVGKWEIVESKDNVVTVKSISDENEREQQAILSFTDDDHFEAQMSEAVPDMKLHAARVKATDKDEKVKEED